MNNGQLFFVFNPNKLILENNQKILYKKGKIKKINFKTNINLNIKKFSFNNKDYLFKNVNIEIEKNSQIGIIGESGSGKSTIVDILCGFQKKYFGIHMISFGFAGFL